VQLFALTRWGKSVIIDHKFIKHCDEKEEYLRRIFQRTGGWCEAVIGNREGHFGAVFSQKRADEIDQSTRVEPRKIFRAFVPCLTASDEGFFIYSSLAILIVFLKSNEV